MSTSVTVFNIASSCIMTNVSFKTENLYEEMLCLTFWKLMKMASKINMKHIKASHKYETDSFLSLAEGRYFAIL